MEEQGGDDYGDFGDDNNNPAGEESTPDKSPDKKGDELFTEETKKSLEAFGDYTNQLERKLHIVID